jgi:hypothetical protein
MEKKVTEFKGQDLDKTSVLPYDSDYVDEFKIKALGMTVKIRPLTKGEKRDARRVATEMTLAISKLEIYTDLLFKKWELHFKCVLGWEGLQTQSGKDVPFNEDGWDLLPDWAKMEISDRITTISGLNGIDKRLLD